MLSFREHILRLSNEWHTYNEYFWNNISNYVNTLWRYRVTMKRITMLTHSCRLFYCTRSIQTHRKAVHSVIALLIEVLYYIIPPIHRTVPKIETWNVSVWQQSSSKYDSQLWTQQRQSKKVRARQRLDLRDDWRCKRWITRCILERCCSEYFPLLSLPHSYSGPWRVYTAAVHQHGAPRSISYLAVAFFFHHRWVFVLVLRRAHNPLFGITMSRFFVLVSGPVSPSEKKNNKRTSDAREMEANQGRETSPKCRYARDRVSCR